MDTSETYIKMCEKAEEIQGLWDMKAGDWLRIRGSKYVSLAYERTARGESGFAEPDAVWLPRQDQLQEMVKDRPFSALLMDFKDSALNNWWNNGFDDSMEQLWLAFVMREKYGKVWDGKKWGQ